MSLKNFFLSLLQLKKRTVTIIRPGTAINSSIIVHPTNYNRYMEASGNITVRGHEFIITKSEMDKITGLFPLKKGDKLVDAEIGTLTITDPEPMYDLGGAIISYRCRTS